LSSGSSRPTCSNIQKKRFKNIFHIYINKMERTQPDKIKNKKYLTTEAHHKAYYKFYDTHKKGLFDKKKNKYATMKNLNKK